MGFLYNKICIGFVICAIKWHDTFGPWRFGNKDSHLLFMQYSCVPKIFLCPFLVDEQSDSSSQHKIACWSCVWFSYINSTDYPIQLLVTGLTASNWKKKSSGLLSTASVSAFTSTIGLSNWALSREAWAWFWPSASTGIRNWARLDSSVTWSQTHPKINTCLCHIKGLGPDSLNQHLISLLFHPIKMHANSTDILPYTSFDVPQKKNVKFGSTWRINLSQSIYMLPSHGPGESVLWPQPK